MRGASHLSVNPADWSETTQPSTSRQSAQVAQCSRPPVHVKSASQLHDSPKSAWRQSLQQMDQDGATASFDSMTSQATTGRKRQTVLIWDLDETLILFHSLLSGAYASYHSPQVCMITSVAHLHCLWCIFGLHSAFKLFICDCRKQTRQWLWARSGKNLSWMSVTSTFSSLRYAHTADWQCRTISVSCMQPLVRLFCKLTHEGLLALT